MSVKNINIIFIGGFLIPKEWISYSLLNLPLNYNILSVYPSPISSIHDRVIEIFYELKGGLINYNKEHLKYYKHKNKNSFINGKLLNWNENEPVYIIGHSYGNKHTLSFNKSLYFYSLSLFSSLFFSLSFSLSFKFSLLQ